MTDNSTLATHAGLSPAAQALKKLTRIVPGFPSEGIVFEDLTPVLADPALSLIHI